MYVCRLRVFVCLEKGHLILHNTQSTRSKLHIIALYTRSIFKQANLLLTLFHCTYTYTQANTLYSHLSSHQPGTYYVCVFVCVCKVCAIVVDIERHRTRLAAIPKLQCLWDFTINTCTQTKTHDTRMYLRFGGALQQG